MHGMYLNVDMLAAGETDRGEAHNDEKQSKVSKVVVSNHVASHDYGHLQDGLIAGLKEGFENFELHSSVSVSHEFIFLARKATPIILYLLY